MPRQHSAPSRTGRDEPLSDLVQKMVQFKRPFLRASNYQSACELLDDIPRNPSCSAFVTYCLQLREKKTYRHSVQDLLAQRRLGGDRKLWFKPTVRTIFSLYKTERALVVQPRGIESSDLRAVSRRQRAELAGGGVLRTRRASSKNLAKRNRYAAANACQAHGAMVWMDNFNKFRYARNVNEERNRCINGTVFAILPLTFNDESLWPGWMPLSLLMRKMNDVVPVVLRSQVRISNEVKTLSQRPLPFNRLRVPCDVRRVGARNIGWTPWAVNGANIGSTVGMLESLDEIMAVQRQYQKVTPILVDVNVYYRILKMLYHRDVVPLNLRGACENHPLVFGLWHAYAHCVKRTFVTFKSLWAALEYPGFINFPETTAVYLKPRVDALEQMIVAMYLIHGERRQEIRDLVNQTKSDFGDDSNMHKHARCLEVLLSEYVPSLFTIGLSVRECYWDLQALHTGARARDVLAFCLNYLLALEKSHRNEYCRVISMALLHWTPYHSMLPAATYVEEVLEASLSRLTRFCDTDLRAHTVEHFSEAYASLGPGRSVADCSKQHVAATLPDRVQIRLDKTIAAIRTGNMPTVSGTSFKAFGSRSSASPPIVPRSPLHDVDDADIRRCVYHSMYTMLCTDALTGEVTEAVKKVSSSAPAVPQEQVERVLNVQSEAKRRLHDVLRRAPTRRSHRRVHLEEDQPVAPGPGTVAVQDSDGVYQSIVFELFSFVYLQG